MDLLDTFIPYSEFFQPILGYYTAYKSLGFKFLSKSILTLGECAAIFQILEVESRKIMMMSPEGVK